MGKLRPAHEVVVEKIQSHCNNLSHLEKAIAAGGVKLGERWIPAVELEQGRQQEIGGLCSQLDTLAIMIVPEDKLEWVIAQLKGLDHPHAAISVTIEKLVARKGVPA